MLGSILKPLKKRYGKDSRYFELADRLFGICPRNIELYKLALIHRSASVFVPGDEGEIAINNERLEFLGDAVLESIVSEYLFLRFPERNEGFLTQVRSKIVSRQSLNDLCQRIGLSEHIISHAGGSVVQKNLYGDALEAMIGALYLDQGYDTANRIVIERVLKRHLDLDDVTRTETDYKSRLIEWCQKSKHTIVFRTGFDEGSTAQAPVFRSVAVIDEMELGYGIGSSKKEAEQHASFAVSQALTDRSGDNVLEWLDNKVE